MIIISTQRDAKLAIKVNQHGAKIYEWVEVFVVS